MNRLQEKKLRKIIKNILLEGSYSADMFAALADSPGGKKISASYANSKSNNSQKISQLFSALRTMRKDIVSIYGESGKALLELLDNIEPTREAFVDEDPTRFLKIK